jgi:hypothetical protein
LRTNRPKNVPTVLTKDEVKVVLVHLSGTTAPMVQL